MRYIFFYLLHLVETSNAAFRGLIVQGKVAKEHEFPYCAHLDVSCTIESWICGSSIINQKVILTAAHCVYNCSDMKMLVKVGNANQNKATVIGASIFKIHEDYDDHRVHNDISIVFLRRSLRFGPNVQRVALLKNPPLNELALTSGWGIKEDGGSGEINMRYTPQNIILHKQCAETLADKPSGTICTLNGRNNQGYPSMGDSGGPLVVRNFIQVGIVSYMATVDNGNPIIVYTSVKDFIPWIRKNMKLYYCKSGA